MATVNDPSSTWRQRFVTWSVALGLLAGGIHLSRIGWLGHEWLSRAGCAVVMLGIWSGLGGMIQERILTGRLRWRRRRAIVRARKALGAKRAAPEEIEKAIASVNEAFAKKTAELSQRLKLSVGFLEFSLLVTGTFFWGFGDLVVEQFVVGRGPSP